MAMRVWGVSRLRDLKVCPRMFVKKYEEKKWIDVPNPNMDRGSRMHKGAEEAIEYGVIMPDEPMFNTVRPYIDQLQQMKDSGLVVVKAEHKFGMDIAFQRTDFFRAPNLRVRCAVDVFVNDGGRVLVIDWKTGRYKPEHEQDADFYGCMVDIGMGAKSTTVQYIYTDEPQFSFDREIKDAGGLARRFYAEFEEADAYLEKVAAEPPMNPAKHCNWCGDITCPNNKNAEAKRIAAQANTNVLFRGGA